MQQNTAPALVFAEFKGEIKVRVVPSKSVLSTHGASPSESADERLLILCFFIESSEESAVIGFMPIELFLIGDFVLWFCSSSSVG